MGNQPNREASQQELAKARGLLEDWRRRKSNRRDPIPAGLWDKAVELAGRHGVGAVAVGLRLDHTKLKNKLAEATKKAATNLPVPVQHAAPVQNAFVELFSTSSPTTDAPAQPKPHVVRFRLPRGVQVRLDWGGSDISGLAKLLKEVL